MDQRGSNCGLFQLWLNVLAQPFYDVHETLALDFASSIIDRFCKVYRGEIKTELQHTVIRRCVLVLCLLGNLK